MMARVKTYRVSLKPERTITVAEPKCSNEREASHVALAWFRAMAPAGECLIVIGLDGRNAVIGVAEVSRGGAHGCALTPADVFKAALAMSASAVILAHNHPSEDPTPSSEDLSMTRAIVDCGKMLGIPVLDHLTVAVRAGATGTCMPS